jgi:hypothetical protein
MSLRLSSDLRPETLDLRLETYLRYAYFLGK